MKPSMCSGSFFLVNERERESRVTREEKGLRRWPSAGKHNEPLP